MTNREIKSNTPSWEIEFDKLFPIKQKTMFYDKGVERKLKSFISKVVQEAEERGRNQEMNASLIVEKQIRQSAYQEIIDEIPTGLIFSDKKKGYENLKLTLKSKYLHE